jgi:hypothetical protein
MPVTLLVTENFTISAVGACPLISGIDPTTGVAGSSMTITGANFTGVTAVFFSGNVGATFTVVSDSQITAVVPAGAGSGPITLRKALCNDVQTGTFTVTVVTPPTQWIVRLFNIDDAASVLVNGTQVLQATFNQDVSADITSLLQPGPNAITFTLDNSAFGYTYGFQVYRDGALYFSEQCGIFNAFGCDNNEQTTGRVVTRTITIRNSWLRHVAWRSSTPKNGSVLLRSRARPRRRNPRAIDADGCPALAIRSCGPTANRRSLSR